MSCAIWWIRRDLRLTDNQTLHAAIDHATAHPDGHVIPLFILDPIFPKSPYFSLQRFGFLLEGLRILAQSLQARGSQLIVRSGRPQTVLSEFVQTANVTAIFAERDHSPYATARDQQIQAALSLHLTDGVSIRTPGTVLKNDGRPYTVYTPYRRKWEATTHLTRHHILPAPQNIPTPETISSEPIPTDPTMSSEIAPLFPPGESAAKDRLGAYVRIPVQEHVRIPAQGQQQTYAIRDYADSRDRPAIAGTSSLSPYLRFGMISARLAAVGAMEAIQQAEVLGDATGRQSAETWLSELIWRDFYISILAAFPHVRQQSFRSAYDNIVWDNDADAFAAWCVGRTGYPFVDAAMRQLRQSGWMHNRARMVVASFLVKHLLIDWRWGERWFMQHLLDGDPAANNGGWQWTAGTGTDAAPYFRVFNPITQGKKFDPTGDYVRRWVPELQRVEKKYIHEPWKMSPLEQRTCQCVIGEQYPMPIVDHKWARERVLDAYKQAKG
ncbi:MAG: deoxyribodipyrimidine photo-lyase [Chloroflexota bacterium]